MNAARLGLLVPFAAGVGTFLYFVYLRGWPALLAVVIGGAVMFLGFAAARTWQRLRSLGDR